MSSSEMTHVCVCSDCRGDEFTELLRKQLKLSKLRIHRQRGQKNSWEIGNRDGYFWWVCVYHGQSPNFDSLVGSGYYRIDGAMAKSHFKHVLAVMEGNLGISPA